MEQFTEPAEGQNDGQATAATLGGRQFRIPLEALEGSKTISRLLSEHEIHANMIRAWERQLLEDGSNIIAMNCEREQREQEAQEAEL